MHMIDRYDKKLCGSAAQLFVFSCRPCQIIHRHSVQTEHGAFTSIHEPAPDVPELETPGGQGAHHIGQHEAGGEQRQRDQRRCAQAVSRLCSSWSSRARNSVFFITVILLQKLPDGVREPQILRPIHVVHVLAQLGQLIVFPGRAAALLL